MPTAIVLPLLLLLRAPIDSGRADDDPRAVVHAAALAMRGDSAPAVRARWEARLRADSADRAAALGLATLARLTYDFDDAARRYRTLFARDTTRPDRYDAWARTGLALGMQAQGMSGDSVLALHAGALASARRSGDREAEGAAHFHIGSTIAPLGRIDEGFQHFDSALRVLPPEGDDVRALVRCRRAQIFIAIARPGSADTMRAAMRFVRGVDEDEAKAVCLRALALQYWLGDRPDSMIATDSALIALRRRMRDRSGLAVALTLHADHLRSRGDFGTALRIFQDALREATASKNRYIEASVTLGLGGTALTLNDHAAAAEYVERAVRAFTAARDSGSLMLALSFRPFVSMAAGDLALARTQTESVLDFWRKQQDWTHLVELLLQLATIEMRAGDYPAAARALDEADAAARRAQSPQSIGTVAYRRGLLALYRGELADAERGFTRFLASMDTSEHLLRYDGRLRLAEVHARRGDVPRAEREITAAGAELDAWRGHLSDPELRTLAFQASPFEANDRNASVATVLAALVRGGRGAAAFDLAERRRARELGERLARDRALRTHAVAASGGARRDSLGAAPALTLADVAPAIPDDRTAVLEYVTGSSGAPTTLFVVTRRTGGTPASYVLAPADSLVGGVSRLVALLEGGDDPRELERALGAALLDPALRGLDSSITRLLVVPDGPLHRVPWDALRLPDGRFAVERFSIGVAPSATVATMLWRARRASPAPSRLLAFGDPALPDATNGEEGETFRSAFAGAGGLPRLPESAREARLVVRFADDGEVRLGRDASADYLLRAPLGRFDVLHFATHALVDDRVATRNALALAPGGIDEDGFVTPADLAALRLDADLVVLSACRSAGGVVVDGEGVQGLTAPLLAAGARSVVATSWRISDRAAVPFVEAFYAGLARGAPIADALRAAKLDALRRGAPPRDWAPFAVVGDPLVVVPLHAPAPRRWWLPALLGLVAVGVLAYLVTRRRRAGERSVPPSMSARTVQR